MVNSPLIGPYFLGCSIPAYPPRKKAAFQAAAGEVSKAPAKAKAAKAAIAKVGVCRVCRGTNAMEKPIGSQKSHGQVFIQKTLHFYDS